MHLSYSAAVSYTEINRVPFRVFIKKYYWLNLVISTTNAIILIIFAGIVSGRHVFAVWVGEHVRGKLIPGTQGIMTKRGYIFQRLIYGLFGLGMRGLLC